MPGHRPARVADAIHKEIAEILLHETKDPRARLASVSRVDVTSDLGLARIWVSVLGDEAVRKQAMEALQGATAFLRRALAPRLRLRAVPELRFELDRGAEHSRKISDLLAELVPPNESDESAEQADTAAIEETDEPVPQHGPPIELVRRLTSARRLLVTSHQNPDGDAIGSELAVARGLAALGKQVVVWNRDPVPRLYTPLAGSDRIHVGTAPPADIADFDGLLFLECPTPDRSGLDGVDSVDSLPWFNVDHHLGNSDYGVVNWVDTQAAAVGEMVFLLLQELQAPIDSDTANALFLALVSDTGGFRYSNSRPRAFRAAAEMVTAGASPEAVATILHERQSEAALRLLAEVLQSLELHAGGRLATVALTDQMLERAGASRQDSEGLIEHPRSIEGVSAVALFRQERDNRFKVSLRSRGMIDVQAVAKSYDGGGHRNASGCLIEGSLNEVRSRVVADLERALASAPESTDLS